MNLATTYGMDSLYPFLPDLVEGEFFCQLLHVFADVKVLLEGSERLRNLDASFFLTREFSRFLLLSVTDWIVVAMTQVQTSAYVVDNYLLLCLGC